MKLNLVLTSDNSTSVTFRSQLEHEKGKALTKSYMHPDSYEADLKTNLGNLKIITKNESFSSYSTKKAMVLLWIMYTYRYKGIFVKSRDILMKTTWNME